MVQLAIHRWCLYNVNKIIVCNLCLYPPQSLTCHLVNVYGARIVRCCGKNLSPICFCLVRYSNTTKLIPVTSSHYAKTLLHTGVVYIYVQLMRYVYINHSPQYKRQRPAIISRIPMGINTQFWSKIKIEFMNIGCWCGVSPVSPQKLTLAETCVTKLVVLNLTTEVAGGRFRHLNTLPGHFRWTLVESGHAPWSQTKSFPPTLPGKFEPHLFLFGTVLKYNKTYSSDVFTLCQNTPSHRGRVYICSIDEICVYKPLSTV